MAREVISDFVMTRIEGERLFNRVFHATVSVTTETGALWWRTKKTVTRPISKEYAGCWYFADTGKWVPDFRADELERAWNAQGRAPVDKPKP